MNTRFADVIRYNPTRFYFGSWTPRLIDTTYNENKCREENRTTPLNIGIISEDIICDALWNEMSYNPERFGTTSPFIFNGKNSIKKFCDYYSFYNPNDKKIIAFKQISDELKRFLEFMKNYDPSFIENGHTSDPIIEVGLEKYEVFSNIGYKLLSSLRKCIHIICSQNGSDYSGIKKYNIKMNEIILARHPNGNRPSKIPNYRLIASIQAQQPKLDVEIRQKEEEISETQMRINVLQEYEGPADTTHEQNLLERQQQELEKLEEQYQDNVNMLKLLHVNPHQK